MRSWGTRPVTGVEGWSSMSLGGQTLYPGCTEWSQRDSGDKMNDEPHADSPTKA